MVIDLDTISPEDKRILTSKMRTAAFKNEGFVLTASRDEEVLQGFEDDPLQELAILLLKESPHFVQVPGGQGVTNYNLSLQMGE